MYWRNAFYSMITTAALLPCVFVYSDSLAQEPPPLPPPVADSVSAEPPPLPAADDDKSAASMNDVSKLLGTDAPATTAKKVDKAPVSKDGLPALPSVDNSKAEVNVDLPVLPSQSAEKPKSKQEKTLPKDIVEDKKSADKKLEVPSLPDSSATAKNPSLPDMPLMPSEQGADKKPAVNSSAPVVLPEVKTEDGSIPDLFKIVDDVKDNKDKKDAAAEPKKEEAKQDKAEKTDSKKNGKEEQKNKKDTSNKDEKESLNSPEILPPADVVPPPPMPGENFKDEDDGKKSSKKKGGGGSFKNNMQSKNGGNIKANYRTKAMSDVIYKREYDAENRHLPKAVYYSDYEQKFFAAIAAGDLTAMRAFMTAGVDVSVRNANGDTPLLFAVRNQRVEAARLLLEHGSRGSEMDSTGLTALHLAVRSGNTELVSVMQRQRGGGSEYGDVDGRTALMYAANNGQIAAVQTLLENGASPNATAANGQTALHMAAARGNTQIVSMLLKKGALAGMTDMSGYTAADYARYYGHNDVADMLAPISSLTSNYGTPAPQSKPAYGGYNYQQPSVDLRSKSGSGGFFSVPQPPVYAPPAASEPQRSTAPRPITGFGNR